MITIAAGGESKLTFAVLPQVEKLVAPLCDDSQTVLNESDDDQETANGWEIPVDGRRHSVSGVSPTLSFRLLFVSLLSRSGRTTERIEKHFRDTTYGLTGSANVSNQSSILLVCSRMASKGLGSLVASARPGPPKGFWWPRLYPAVPRICAIAKVVV